jgi:hypothetical protein
MYRGVAIFQNTSFFRYTQLGATFIGGQVWDGVRTPASTHALLPPGLLARYSALASLGFIRTNLRYSRVAVG